MQAISEVYNPFSSTKYPSECSSSGQLPAAVDSVNARILKEPMI